MVISDSLGERMHKLNGVKQERVRAGLYPKDFVVLVLNDLSASNDGFGERNVETGIKHARRKGVPIIKEHVCGRPLNLMGVDGLSFVVEFYRGLGKVRDYSPGKFSDVVRRKTQDYLSGRT